MKSRKSKSQNPLIHLHFLFFFSFGFCPWSIYQNQILWTMPLLEKYRNTHFSASSQVLSSNSHRCEKNQILKIRGIALSSPVFFTILPQRILKSYFLTERTTYVSKGTRLQWEHWAKLIQFLAQVPLASPLAFVLSPVSHENKYTICPDPRKIQLSYTIQRPDLFIFPQWRLHVLSYWFGT